MLFNALALLAVSSLASATIFVTTPVVSSSFAGGASIPLAWIIDDSAPNATLFGPTTIGLFVGSLTQQTMIQNLGTVQNPVMQTKLQSPIINAAGGANSEAYFIRFESVAARTTAGVPLQAFSARFTLTGMTGTFSPAVLQQIGGSSSAAASGTGTRAVTATGTATGTASVATGLTASAAPSAISRTTSSALTAASSSALNATATALPRSAGERVSREGGLAVLALGMALYVL